MLTILQSFGIWSKLKRWKSLLSGCLMSWLKIRKTVTLKCHLLLFYATTTNHFSNHDMWWNVDFIWQSVTTSLMAGPSSSSKALPKAKLEPKRGHGHCFMVCCPSDPLQLSESQQNHYISEVYSVNQWDSLKTAIPTAGHWSIERAYSSPQQHLPAFHTTNASKVKQTGLWSFASSATFTWPLPQLPLFQASQQLFARKMLPQAAGCRKCFQRVRWILKHRFLCYRNKQTYFLSAKLS